MYRHLDPHRIGETLVALSQRIDERFPGSGLGRVNRELIEISQRTAHNVELLRRPLWPIRIAAVVGAVAMIALFGMALYLALRTAPGTSLTDTQVGLSEYFQGIEALVNDVVFLGIAVWFVMTLETRVKRRRALAAIHELRSISHIVDMHQLTKDPERLLTSRRDTASSPARNMTREELSRYLDYCSEMLSVTSKLAALYAQNFADPVVLETVSEVETLTTGLSGKIWQKIQLLQEAREASAVS